MGKSGAELEKAVNDAARFTGLKDELLEKSPFDLSGGEKRRAAIAGVIAMNPEVLVLDEPTARNAKTQLSLYPTAWKTLQGLPIR